MQVGQGSDHCSSLPHMVRVRLPWGWGVQGAALSCAGVVLTAGCRTSMFLLPASFPLSSGTAWTSSLTRWLRYCPFFTFVIVTASLLPHSRGGGRDYALDGENSMCIKGWGKLQGTVFANNLPQTP